MPIVQQGSINTAALIVPNLYVQIVPPQNLVLNGVPTNVAGVVGSASWGPVNQPVTIGTMQDYATSFGPVVARKFDMGTHVATAVQQGAQDFRCVRVTDGTDTAATITVAGALLLAARHTGSVGNSISVFLSQGSQAGTWKLRIGLPGQVQEVFDNISASPAASFWANVASAVNNGSGALRGPSQIAVASVLPGAASVAAAVEGPGNMMGGTDGASGVSAATLVGQDVLPRQGMYALRSSGCSVGLLADADDSSQWTTQAAFGLSEGVYMILTGPSGDTIGNAVATKASAGLDSYAAKLMFGDWLYWNDQTNGTMRLVSPQGFVAGRLGNLSPEQSSLNKQIYSVAGSQRSGPPGSGQVTTYSDAELQTLFAVGIDVICNPQPGGAYWGCRLGHNSASNAAVSGDNYTRLTNFIAATLAAGMGQFVGAVINPALFLSIRSTQLAYLQGLLGQGILGLQNDGSVPFSVICDASNNPQSRTALGYVQADAQVVYQGINEKFIVNMEAGQTVTVAKQTLPAGQS